MTWLSIWHVILYLVKHTCLFGFPRMAPAMADDPARSVTTLLTVTTIFITPTIYGVVILSGTGEMTVISLSDFISGFSMLCVSEMVDGKTYDQACLLCIL